MLERLEQIEARYEELANELSAPELLADQTAYTKAARQHRTLGEIVEKFRTWKTLKTELEGAQELVDSADDDEMREMARSEVETLQQKLEAIDKELKLLLVPSSQRREECNRGNSRRHGRRRSDAVCCRNGENVQPLC